MNRKTTRTVLATLGTLALITGTATTATALGSETKQCSSVAAVTGNSSAGGSAQTWTLHSSICGELGVRIFYTLYPGSLTYYTSWEYGYTSVYKSNPGNIVHGANHVAKRGSDPDVTFSS